MDQKSAIQDNTAQCHLPPKKEVHHDDETRRYYAFVFLSAGLSLPLSLVTR